MAEAGEEIEEQLREKTRALIKDFPPDKTEVQDFRGRQFDSGLALVNFPEGYGGLGISPGHQRIVSEELASAKGITHDLLVNPIGIGMGMPTVLSHGSDEMKERLLRPCFTGEDIWCQLFSEPGAGSDVAGLATRAIEDGDEWVVTGQKVWTSLAHRSRWGMLLARTDPDQPKHKGMTYFVMDMQAEGVEIRPLYQLTGEAEFNEVYMNEVRIPDSMRLGERGQGWSVAITTLMNERVALGGGTGPRGSGSISLLVDTWQKHQPQKSSQQYRARRDRVMELWVKAEALRLTTQRARDNASLGIPGPEGSVGKLMSAELNKTIYECSIDIMGAEGLIHDRGYPLSADELRAAGSYTSHVSSAFLRSRANSIEGGTSEIMRNILGERVLGLPKEPQVDKEIPWSEIKRG